MSPPTGHYNKGLAPNSHAKNVDDWEEWEDDDVITPIDAGEQVNIHQPPNQPALLQNRKTKSTNLRTSRLSTAKVRRLKSRQRQKAQNANAGIRLITDMSVFRRNNHVANYMRSPTGRTGRFVDAAALRALEGEPSSASVGNWNWLKRGHGKTPDSATPVRADRNKDQEMSPEDRPIVIGISLPSSDMEGREISPQTAVINNLETPYPMTVPKNDNTSKATRTDGTNAQKSVWSPDTPDTIHSFGSNRAPSSVYSQMIVPKQLSKQESPPPVPELPSDYKKSAHQRVVSIELTKSQQDDDDSGTPCTLFEEDGVPSPQRQIKARGLGISPDSAGSRSHGWWDHVVTPFVDKRMSFSSRKHKIESPKSPKSPKSIKEQPRLEQWESSDIKEKPFSTTSPKVAPAPIQAPIVRAPTPRRTPPLRSDAKAQEKPQTPLKKAPILVAGPSIRQTPQIVITRDSASALDYPPPYSPPKKRQQDNKHIRYRAVFPPGHPLHSQFPPSPRPASPGLAATMTSQGGNHIDTIDHTPALLRTQTPPIISEPLPVRAVGTFVPQEHAYSAAGTRHKVERQRRRHEKEDVMARRAGGFWRGRGCLPSKGCFGRTGREGRKRRRVWMAIWGAIIALLLLIILLAVLLTRHHSPAEIPSIWVNLTDFPPMPTGVLTVVGPDNTAARSSCTAPTTAWSCALPKDQQSSVAPYKPNQPTVIFQIQWDNGTRKAWNVPNGDPPTAIARRAFGAAAHALSILKRAVPPTSEFTPDPAPPKFQEMWFLGETTDNIKSAQKAGEPTPFYISILKSLNDTVSTPKLTRRDPSENLGNTTFKDIIPPPEVEKDGTSVPAVMIPNPIQQPIRLFDRGLPTEHYGFYTYAQRTIFLKSVNILNNKTNTNIPLDEDGGCRKTEASNLVTWAQTRLHVQIWTRTLERNTSSLVNSGGSKGIGGTGELVRPGTMPYPVTITQDTHGGTKAKVVWDRPIDDRLQVSTKEAQVLFNDIGVAGTWINPRATGDPKFGGFDGGSGGCTCEWVNWV